MRFSMYILISSCSMCLLNARCVVRTTRHGVIQRGVKHRASHGVQRVSCRQVIRLPQDPDQYQKFEDKGVCEYIGQAATPGCDDD